LHPLAHPELMPDVICAMSKARDLPVVLSYGGAHSMAAAAAGLGTVLVERNFLHGSR
jgi:hypothetical protein